MRQNMKINNHTKLCIGPYIINISLPGTDSQEFYLPDKTKEFIDNSVAGSPERIINYQVNFESFELEADDVLLTELKEGSMPYQIIRRKTGEYLWIRQNYNKNNLLVYCISRDWNHWRLVKDDTKSWSTDSFNELSYIFPYSVLNKSGIMFHGVVMEWQGYGIIVCAHSGIGKTTHTRMWRDHENALILNGDRALCYKNEGEWYTCGAPWCGSSGEYRNRSIKLSVVVVLEQADQNKVKILSQFEGALVLIQLAFAPAWEQGLMNYTFDHIDNITRNIPVFKLSCKPDLASVALLKNEFINYIHHTENVISNNVV